MLCACLARQRITGLNRGNEMTGTQRDVYEGLVYLAECVKDGRYGTDDNFDEFDFNDDFADNVTDKLL